MAIGVYICIHMLVYACKHMEGQAFFPIDFFLIALEVDVYTGPYRGPDTQAAAQTDAASAIN